MKRYCFTVVSVLILLASCAKAPDGASSADGQIPMKTLEFTTSMLTRTTLSPDGEVCWEEGDEISVHYVKASGEAVTESAFAEVHEDGKAVFKLQIPASENPTMFYAAYPSGKSTLVPGKGGSPDQFFLSFGFSDGTFKSSNYMAACASSELLNFVFKNAGAIIRVKLPKEKKIVHGTDVYTITGVTVKGQKVSFPQLTDKLPVLVENAQVIGFGEPASETTSRTGTKDMQAAVLDGEYVYVPSLPGEYTAGCYIQYGTAEAVSIPAVLTPQESIVITRGHVRTLVATNEDIIWDYFVSEKGGGDGRSESAPMSLMDMSRMVSDVKDTMYRVNSLNSVTFHLEGGVTMTTGGNTIFNMTGSNNLHIRFEGGWKNSKKTILDAEGKNRFINGGGILSFSNIVFRGGLATSTGGGVLYAESGTYEFENCDFVSNSAGTNTGGAMLFTGNSNARMKDCTFVDNNCSGNSGGAVTLTAKSTGNYYFTNCIFFGNDTGAYYGAALHCAKSLGFLGMNNCLLYDNFGSKKGADGASNIHMGIKYCVLNTSFISTSAHQVVFGIRCGSFDTVAGFGGGLLLNNIILNDNVASGSYVPYALSTVNTSYWLRSVGYNQYNSYNDNDYFSVSDYDNMIGCPIEGSKPTLYSYTWNPETLRWAWDCSSKTGDMIDRQTMSRLVREDSIDGIATAVRPSAKAFMEWLESLSYNNGADNALTVDLYGNKRDAGAIWPGCYQK